MSSVCRNKEAAWEYIRTLITPRVIESDTPGLDILLPVNKANYKTNMRNDLKQVERMYLADGDEVLRDLFKTKHFTYGDPIPLMRLLTEEDIQRINDLIDHTTRLYWPDDGLTDIVWEVLGAYFFGDRALDDTIRLLENRVGLYLNEQK